MNLTFVNLNIVGFGNFIIAVCYRSPSADQQEVANMMWKIRKYSNKTAIIMGDFNYGKIIERIIKEEIVAS